MSIAIMSRLFRLPMGGVTRKMLAIRLADFADDDGRGIWPTVARLATETELSERTIQRTLREFVDEGILVVVSSASGRPGQATRYDFDLRALDRLAAQGRESQATGDSVSPVENRAERGDTDAGTGDMGDIDGCHHVTRTVIEPPVEPSSEREGASERETGQAVETAEHDEPGKLLKRIKALEIGRHANPWPGVLGSSTDWALKQFEKLTPDERRMAEERRDAYLALCEAQKTRPVALGVYLRDRKFLDVKAQAERVARGEKIAVAPFGPIWAGMRALALLRGPRSIDLPLDLRDRIAASYEALRRASEDRARRYLAGKDITLDDRGQLVFPVDFEQAEARRRQIEEGYPEVNRLHRLIRDQADAASAGLADLCEPVPIGSDLYEAWREHHVRMGWPQWPDPGAMRVVWFPKGGPEGLEDFRRAAAGLMVDAKERTGHVHAAAQ